MLPALGSATLPLVVDELLGTPLQQVLGIIVVLGIVVFVGRFVLKVAWKLLVVAGVVVTVLYVLSLVGL